MKNIPLYKFHKRKYGTELLVDVLDLDYVKKGIRRTPVHRETFYCLILITEGCEKVGVDGEEREVQTGDVICSRPREVWSWMPEPELKGYVLIFEEQFLLSFFNDSQFLQRFAYLQTRRPSPFLHPDHELFCRLLHLFRQMKAEIDDDRTAEKDEHILRAMLYETLMLLNRAESAAACLASPKDATTNRSADTFVKKDTSADRYADAFVKLAAQEFATQHEVEYYAAALCITPNYLNKIIRRQLGITTKQYLTRQIADEAKRLLAYTSLPIADIADRLHFDTATYFVRFFRKATGTTPSHFRKQSRS